MRGSDAPPAISVVIPTYNQARYLAQSIDSVLAQGESGVEIIVVDDGSEDETAQVAAAYGARVLYIRQSNGGVAKALNRGIRESRGRYICCLSSDDMYCEGALTALRAPLDSQPELDLVYGDWRYVDEKGEPVQDIRSPYFRTRKRQILWMFRYCYFMHDTVMFRADFLKRLGGFEEDLPYCAEWSLWFRCLREGTVGHVPARLVEYRVHPGQLSTHASALRRYRAEVIRRARAAYGPAWTLRSVLLANRLVGIAWLGVGLVLPSRRHGLYWGKQVVPFQDTVLRLYLRFLRRWRRLAGGKSSVVGGR